MRPFPTINLDPSPISYDKDKQFMLYGSSDGKSEIIKNLLPDEAEILIANLKILDHFVNLEWHYLEAELNYSDYISSSLQKFKTDSLTSKMYVGQNLDVLNASRICRNYVTAWRLGIENMEKQIFKTHGPKSVEGQSWKKFSSQAYDNHFAYRFVSRLRNVAEHVVRIIDRIDVRNGEFTPVFRKQVLMESGFPAIFNDDWNRLNSTFPVEPILTKSLQLLGEAQSHCFQLNKVKMLESAHIIKQAIPENTFNQIYLGENLPKTAGYPHVQSTKMQLISLDGCDQIISKFS